MGAALVAGLAAPLHAAGEAAVSVDFLADGRCAVAAKGEGFRTSATYRPDGVQTAGDRRCAMPPIPGGRTVSLRVSLPAGSPRPGKSSPDLVWNEAGGAWVGTASLSSWPDAVVLTPRRGPDLVTLSVGGTLLLALAGWTLRRRRSAAPTNPAAV